MKLPKIYEPGQYEENIYALWEKAEAFKPTGKGAPYSIVVPPPNANGNAHLGTAITLYLEDIAARYHRLKGDRVLFVPGADHAGFETQVVYEKKLAKEGKSRFDYTREELYSGIWDFVAENRQNFEGQFRRLGGSLDWSRYTFTLDEKVVSQAYKTFKRLWDEGLVYRGERLVNFCTFHGTAFADIEVVHTEEAGKLWYIRYPLTDGTGDLVVATTRPETMLGDTGVAVHPDDARYHRFIGKTVKLPLTNREIPVIADDFVDKEFGTGAVKLTPAHDQNDYDAASRHDLPRVTVINAEGRMTETVPQAYRHLTADEARAKVVADLEEQGVLVKVEEHVHNVSHCYKCNTPIQPLLREQWFIDMQPLAARAVKSLKNNEITFYPDQKKHQLATYLENLRDWNISRQIAWGIPIPAFRNVDDPSDWIYDERVSEELITVDGKTYHRDPDVFDTWFSSSSWPYATLGVDSEDFKDFYPLSLMETGGEILYPWVSRMLMLGLFVTDEIPFREVYIHGYVMAEDGSKMSKSLGNVVDPMPVIEQYGSDALRMGLISGRAPAVNRGYDPRKVEEARNFCNKLWNIARYIEDKLGDQPVEKVKPVPQSVADEWMLMKLQQTADGMADHLEQYRFSEAYDVLYHFVWDDFADWYIEASKAKPNPGMLVYGLETILKIAHPFAPFVTETIWQTLGWNDDRLLVNEQWPKDISYDKKDARTFEEIQAIVTEVRFIITSLQVTDVILYHNGTAFLTENTDLIKRLTKLSAIREVSDGTGVYLTSTGHACWLDIDEVTARNYHKQLEGRRAEQEKVIAQLEGRLANKGYVSKAPQKLIDETKDQLEAARQMAAKITEEMTRYNQD